MGRRKHHNEAVRTWAWTTVFLLACGSGSEPTPAAGRRLPPTPTPLDPACLSATGTVTEVAAPTALAVHHVAASEAALVATIVSGTYVSHDGGQSWTALPHRFRAMTGDASGFVALDFEGRPWVAGPDGDDWVEATAGLATEADVQQVTRGGGVAAAVVDGQVHRWDGASWRAMVASPAPIVLTATDGNAFLSTAEQGLFETAGDAAWQNVPLDAAWAYVGLSVRGARRLASSMVTFARSDDDGATWVEDPAVFEQLGPVDSILDGGEVVLASGKRGLFRSADGGFSWGYVPGTHGFAHTDLAGRGGHLFAAVGPLLASEDGITWSRVDGLRPPTVADLMVAGELVLARSDDDHLHHWSAGDWSPREDLRRVKGLVEVEGGHLAIRDELYTSTLVRSTDGGATWFEVAAPSTDRLRYEGLSRAGDVLLVAAPRGIILQPGEARPGAGVFRSDDGGQSWRSARTGLPLASGGYAPVTALAGMDGGAVAHVQGHGMYLSTDLESWQALDVDAIQLASDGHRVLALTEEGLLLILSDGRRVDLEAPGPVTAIAGGNGRWVVTVEGEGLFVGDGTQWSRLFEREPHALAMSGDTVWWATPDGLGVVELTCD